VRKSSCWMFWREPTINNHKTVTEVTHDHRLKQKEKKKKKKKKMVGWSSLWHEAAGYTRIKAHVRWSLSVGLILVINWQPSASPIVKTLHKVLCHYMQWSLLWGYMQFEG
jgi:hypothetical protein